MAANTKVEHDNFKKLLTVQSPKVKGTMGTGYDGEYYEVFFRGWKPTEPGKSAAELQVYVATDHTGRWHYYRATWDEDGQELGTIKIDSDVYCLRSGCRYQEDVGISVDREYLEAHRASGMRLKVDGPGGHVVVRVPPAYVSGFLRRFDGARPVQNQAMH